MSENLRRSLLRTITIACEGGEEPRPANEDWMRAMMRMYLLSQNA
ncbi:MAG: hypothetical protein R6U10_02810 [Thermoplasmatota archaeon]